MNRSPEEMVRWIKAARAGDQEALGRLLEAFKPYLLLVAGKELDPELRAKASGSDLVQQTFAEACRDFADFQGNTEAELLAWLRQILLHNLANFRTHFGAAKRPDRYEVSLNAGSSSSRRGLNLTADEPSPSEQFAAKERAAAVRRTLARLPEPHRQVLLWRYQDQVPFEEIAQRLECTPNAARKLWKRALGRFEEEWEGPDGIQLP